MVEQPDHQNDAVLRAVDDAFETDLPPIPAALTRFAEETIEWRHLDDELAAVVFDSSMDRLAGVRGAATERKTLRFKGSGLVVSFSLVDESVIASIEPPARYDCWIEGPDVSTHVMTDDSGQLASDRCPLPVRLAVQLDHTRFVSPWIIG